MTVTIPLGPLLIVTNQWIERFLAYVGCSKLSKTKNNDAMGTNDDDKTIRVYILQ